MIYKIQKFLLLAGIFSIGMYGGEWLLDTLLEISRPDNFKEIIEAVVIGHIMAVLWSLRKRK